MTSKTTERAELCLSRRISRSRNVTGNQSYRTSATTSASEHGARREDGLAGTGSLSDGSEDSGVTRATVLADGRGSPSIPSMAFRRRGGRKLVVTPDGAEWAPRPRVDNAMVKALARAFRWRKMLDAGVHATLEDLARAKGVARVLRQPGPAADAARAGDRGGDPRRAAAGGAAAG